jgi:hypothetical protein
VPARLNKKTFLVVLVAAGLCASVPLALADPGRTRIDMSKSPGQDAGSLAPAIGPDRPARIPPDPSPMVEKGQWVFDLRYDKGDLFLVGLHRMELAAAQATPRAMGRFALELFEGPTLIERVRFDFPLLGAGDSFQDAGFFAAPSFERKLNTRIGVMFPASSRGNRLELWDRATNKRWSLPWPPTETRAAADAGKDGG